MVQQNLEPSVIWWIRRDLRLGNNPALLAALSSGLKVIPVFVLDDRLLVSPENRRQRFLISGLHRMAESIRESGGQLVIRRGKPEDELRRLVEETGAKRIFAEEDYSPYARKRDLDVGRILPLEMVSGLTVHHPGAVLKDDGTPYTVFTPFSRKWKSLPEFNPAGRPIGSQFQKACWLESIPLPDGRPIPGFPAGEVEALTRLLSFFNDRLEDYDEARDRMDLDGTSALSPYLRFGMISPAFLVAEVRALIRKFANNKGALSWLNELVWREFYQSILYHFPVVNRESFNPKYRNVTWRNDSEELDAWRLGMTGYPVVDAGMRQLVSTGWMHNRARMITASFLTKDLLIDWREGERWFMEKLVDGDMASNNGGWQWSAGTGTDAAPYYRIFNPVLQGKKFDPHGDYVRCWVPELGGVSAEWIHEPWLMPESLQTNLGVTVGKDYPKPIVDHRMARDRALAAYKAAVG
ncbi:MAG: deoxyribodipyrimidine photo-lyase [Leptolinea sp.]|nr:deoxyribodipyrimidine photo-lyase [Leptolinea sp.]